MYTALLKSRSEVLQNLDLLIISEVEKNFYADVKVNL